MTTQTSNTPSLKAVAGSKQSPLAAGRIVNESAFQLAQNAVADEADLRKKAEASKAAAEDKATAQAEEAAQQAAETQATETAAAAEAVETAGAEAGAATTAAASSVSPWVVAAGVAGAAGLAVALKDDDDDNNNTAKSGGEQNSGSGATTDTGSSNTGTSTSGDNTNTGSNTGSADNGGSSSETGGTTTPTQPADDGKNPLAEGEPSAPVVATDRITDLDARTFTTGLPEGATGIKIVSIMAAEGTIEQSEVVGGGNPRDFRTFETDNGRQTNAYEVIKVAGEGLTWAEAAARAEAMGGKLLVINNEVEANFIRTNLSSRLGDSPWEYSGENGLNKGAWIGLSQDATATEVTGGWKWADGTVFSAENWQTSGFKIDGQTMPTDGDPASGAIAENGEANYGAIAAAYDTVSGSYTGNMIYDYGGKLNAFVIEYEAYEGPLKVVNDDGTTTVITDGQVLATDLLDNLTWNSATNNGGKITFIAVGENDVEIGTATTVTLTEKAATAAASGYSEGSAALKSDIASLLDESYQALI